MRYPTYNELEEWVRVNKNTTFIFYDKELGKNMLFKPDYADITMDEIKRKTGHGNYAVFSEIEDDNYANSIEDIELDCLTPLTTYMFKQGLEDL